VLKVLLNGEEVESVDWTRRDHVTSLHPQPGMNQIDVVVENCGRVNYADYNSSLLDSQRKGQNWSDMLCCVKRMRWGLE